MAAPNEFCVCKVERKNIANNYADYSAVQKLCMQSDSCIAPWIYICENFRDLMTKKFAYALMYITTQ